MKEKKKLNKEFSKERGITLVALVITIIILIILATVTINFAFGSNGLIKRAQLAKEYYTNDTAYTDESILNVTSYLNDVLNGTTGESETEGDNSGETENKSEIEQAINEGNIFDDTTDLDDKLGNKVWIPGGFGVASDSGTKVEEGIVIEDEQGNQFVWIPVGTYKTSSGEKINNLNRRIFNTDSITEVGDGLVPYTWNADIGFYGEGDSRSIASDTIGNFKMSATTKGGFYIGRYEQGNGNVCKKDQLPYVDVTRDEAMTLSESMYSGSSYVVSELISGYAADTALNFMVQLHEDGNWLAVWENPEYGNIGTGNKERTGITEAGVHNNICDFIGNVREWTTEYSEMKMVDVDEVEKNAPCVCMSSCYLQRSYASQRSSYKLDDSHFSIGFRVQLYVL